MKTLFSLILLPLWLLAGFPSGYWKQNGTLELEKDQTFRFAVSSETMQKDLSFRWTLYKNRGLVLHLKYDGFVHQFILYTDYQRSSFKLPIKAEPEKKPEEAPYFMLVFKDFNRKSAVATLDYYLRTGDAEIDIQVGN